VFFIKKFKSTGVKDENDRAFQKQLRKVITDPAVKLLREPDKPEPVSRPLPNKRARKK
jgi:hypothetical protein